MKAVTSSEEDLRQLFLTESNNQGVIRIALSDEFESARSWMKGAQEEINFDFKEREETN